MSDWLSELDTAFKIVDSSGAIIAPGSLANEFDNLFAGTSPDPDTHEQTKAKQRARMKKVRGVAKKERIKFIAVLDMETDPFDANLRERIFPFAACLYGDTFDTVMIWEENESDFIDSVIAAIMGLPDSYTIYAHNGGRFDFLFLIHRLRGPVSFKGRGIMSARIGPHELRDSFHIIPEKLAAFQKDVFDYEKMRKGKRNNYRAEIEKYLLNDCIYLFDIVKTFLNNYGLKISIGQAAMHLLRQHYPDCENLTAMDDEFMRGFFFGGRVECIAGAGEFEGEYKLYDVNSMYPDVMANSLHPIGKKYIPRRGAPDKHTCFVDLVCFSNGAFPVKRDGIGTVFPVERGRYRVSIHEYNIALKYNLISQIEINYCVDNLETTKFDRFINPLYEGRLLTKEQLGAMQKAGDTASANYIDTKKDDIFLKLLMNNAYGKFAQNPRRFKEHYLTEWNGVPEDEPETWGSFPSEMCGDYAIWSRPIQKLRFNNVGTAASITGGARAKLLEAKCLAIDPIYCDTDSLICRELPGVDLHKSRLGAWDLEADISRVMIAGKKTYAYETIAGKQLIKSKGVRGLSWHDMQALANGGEITVSAFAPTLTRNGEQHYIDRKVRSTTARKV